MPQTSEEVGASQHALIFMVSCSSVLHSPQGAMFIHFSEWFPLGCVTGCLW